jgi:hypothetical protein
MGQGPDVGPERWVVYRCGFIHVDHLGQLIGQLPTER